MHRALGSIYRTGGQWGGEMAVTWEYVLEVWKLTVLLFCFSDFYNKVREVSDAGKHCVQSTLADFN